MQLDISERKLLNLVQAEFPLTIEPFADLAQHLGIDTEEVIQKIKKLKEMRIIRLIGPVIDSRSLGFHSTLVAMEVAEANLDKAEEVIANHTGVSHGYERDHRFNVWFTLALPPTHDIGTELKELIQSTGAEIAFSLQALKVFKIGAYFDMDENEQTILAAQRKNVLTEQLELSNADRRIINELQQDLALEPEPFSEMAERVGMDTEQFLAGCRSLQERGIIRRFSASINHRNAGFTANAMSCWEAPSVTIEVVGQKLASLKEVSHCYQRDTNRHWRYNLFAMIHGHSREQCQSIVDNISAETRLNRYILLYSTREFKKTRVKYLV
jgi:DNA-binding Lrp family transcriptional regulator